MLSAMNAALVAKKKILKSGFANEVNAVRFGSGEGEASICGSKFFNILNWGCDCSCGHTSAGA